MLGITLKQYINKIFLSITLLFATTGCQQSNNVPLDTASKNIISNKKLPSPCKKATTASPIKNKEKLKKMLIKEGKITQDMADDEINKKINEYIKRKNTSTCKPTLKRSAFIFKDYSYA